MQPDNYLVSEEYTSKFPQYVAQDSWQAVVRGRSESKPTIFLHRRATNTDNGGQLKVKLTTNIDRACACYGSVQLLCNKRRLAYPSFFILLQPKPRPP